MKLNGVVDLMGTLIKNPISYSALKSLYGIDVNSVKSAEKWGVELVATINTLDFIHKGYLISSASVKFQLLTKVINNETTGATKKLVISYINKSLFDVTTYIAEGELEKDKAYKKEKVTKKKKAFKNHEPVTVMTKPEFKKVKIDYCDGLVIDGDAELVNLCDAVDLYQAVKATSGSSIYHVVAVGDINVAVRLTKLHRLSVRVEKKISPKIKNMLITLGFKVDTSKMYASIHLDNIDLFSAKYFLGGLVHSLDVPFTQLGINKLDSLVGLGT